MSRSRKLLLSIVVALAVAAVPAAASASPSAPPPDAPAGVHVLRKNPAPTVPSAPSGARRANTVNPYGEFYTINYDDYWFRTASLSGWQRYWWMGDGDCRNRNTHNAGSICYDLYSPSGVYSNTVRLGGIVFDSFCVGLNSNDTEEVFAKALGKDVVHIWQTGDDRRANAWSSWQSLGGLIADGHGVECPTYNSAPRYKPANGLLAFRVWGPDGMYHYKQQLTPHGNWQDHWS